MKKIVLGCLIATVFLIVLSGQVKANDNPCGDYCLDKALLGWLTDEDYQLYGMGNIIRTVTEHFQGDLWKALKVLGFAESTYHADMTVNMVFNTQLDGNILGLYICQTNYIYCTEGEILGYYQVDDKIIRVHCSPNIVCQENFLFDEMAANTLVEIFHNSKYYGGEGSWK